MADKTKWAVLTDDQKDSLKRKTNTNWRDQILKYLTADNCKNNGMEDIELYNATRPDRLNISDTKKRHNVASQITYLRDDNIKLRHDNGKLTIIADHMDRIYPGAEKHV